MSKTELRFKAEGKDPSKLRLPVVRDWGLILGSGVLGTCAVVAAAGYVFMGVWTESITAPPGDSVVTSDAGERTGPIERQLGQLTDVQAAKKAEREQLLEGNMIEYGDPSVYETRDTDLGTMPPVADDASTSTDASAVFPEGAAELLNRFWGDAEVQSANALRSLMELFDER